MDNRPTIEFDPADLELIPDDDAPELVIDLADEIKDISIDPELEIIPLPKPLYYMEYTKPSALDGITNNGTFHSDYIKPFVKKMRSIGITILLLRRESDGKILINAPVEPMARA